MKISELEKLSVREILKTLELSPEFLSQFEEWCIDKPPAAGYAGYCPVYGKNPFLSIISGD